MDAALLIALSGIVIIVLGFLIYLVISHFASPKNKIPKIISKTSRCRCGMSTVTSPVTASEFTDEQYTNFARSIHTIINDCNYYLKIDTGYKVCESIGYEQGICQIPCGLGSCLLLKNIPKKENITRDISRLLSKMAELILTYRNNENYVGDEWYTVSYLGRNIHLNQKGFVHELWHYQGEYRGLLKYFDGSTDLLIQFKADLDKISNDQTPNVSGIFDIIWSKIVQC